MFSEDRSGLGLIAGEYGGGECIWATKVWGLVAGLGGWLKDLKLEEGDEEEEPWRNGELAGGSGDLGRLEERHND